MSHLSDAEFADYGSFEAAQLKTDLNKTPSLFTAQLATGASGSVKNCRTLDTRTFSTCGAESSIGRITEERWSIPAIRLRIRFTPTTNNGADSCKRV